MAGLSNIAAGFLACAVAFGTVLVVIQFRGSGPPPIPWPVAAMHAVLGAVGIAALIAALKQPPQTVVGGVGQFRLIATALLVPALLVGLFILAQRVRRRHLSFGAVGLHALLAISGFVILLAYVTA